MCSQRILKDSMDEGTDRSSHSGIDATEKLPDAKKKAMSWGVYFRTIRHLRLSQLLWRIRYQLERRKKIERVPERWRWPEGKAPHIRTDFPDVPVIHAEHNYAQTVAELGRGEFRLLNRSRQLGREHPDWRLGVISEDRLWTITLHYHAWAYDLACAATTGTNADEALALFRHYLSDWLSRCTLESPGARALAWNPYAIATRLMWWIRCHRLLAPLWRDWGRFEQDFRASLWQQAAYLRDHLEWDLRGNHLMRNSLGLAWAGRFFDEEAAREWLKTATRVGVEQVEEQFLPDGGHFERSPMYHLHVMEDVLSLALLVEDPQTLKHLGDAWERMAEFLAWMRHPDGDVALFNDGGLVGAAKVEGMIHAGERLDLAIDPKPRQGGAFFAQTGMAVCHGDPWTLFFDVGPVGPDYQPGHTHADTLSIECSYRGRRLFVDAGTYAYDHDERRHYDRSTSAHNAVCIDGQDSSEVWHIFRVGRRAYPQGVQIDISGHGLKGSASHTGYDHLPGRPRHTRRVAVEADGRLTITDNIEGIGQHQLAGGYLLDPEWSAAPAANGWVLRNGALSVRVTVRGPEGLALSEEPRSYHPDYGRELQSTRLCWRVVGGLPVEVSTFVEGVGS